MWGRMISCNKYLSYSETYKLIQAHNFYISANVAKENAKGRKKRKWWEHVRLICSLEEQKLWSELNEEGMLRRSVILDDSAVAVINL